ncbi:MAG: ATP-binding cassette domain-containing protein [Syntrophorhabdaceae bacterium]|nr:ATP-binding cassette domain-containing protein [Syntrophorhabdaceae bacterium]
MDLYQKMSPTPDEDIISVDNLTKRFDDFIAIDQITFKVKRGEIFAFLGPNGAGKSTTIKILTTLLRPTEGTITIDGYDPQLLPHKVRESFGIVFQDPSLDEELTAFENMEYHGILYNISRHIRRKRIEELLGMVELWDRRHELVKYFSGGMKRRLEIARGLMHYPKILFLDEPTLGLDPQTRSLIWGHIKEMNRTKGVTLFFTTHYMEEAERVAERIAIIDHGRIIIQGTPEMLKKETKTENLEEAFISLTGRDIRAEDVSRTERMKMRFRVFKRQRS